MILNDGARADSMPSLRIQNNDVRCTHGSTTGKLNADAIFYLMSRGLPRTEAERLAVAAFFEDLLADSSARVQELLRGHISAAIDDA